MGRMRTEEMLEYGGYEAALRDHLSANLYPPNPVSFELADKMIQQAADDPDAVVLEVVSRSNGESPSVAAVIIDLHLEPFVAWQEEANEHHDPEGRNA